MIITGIVVQMQGNRNGLSESEAVASREWSIHLQKDPECRQASK